MTSVGVRRIYLRNPLISYARAVSPLPGANHRCIGEDTVQTLPRGSGPRRRVVASVMPCMDGVVCKDSYVSSSLTALGTIAGVSLIEHLCCLGIAVGRPAGRGVVGAGGGGGGGGRAPPHGPGKLSRSDPHA
jgi:hypothetical protein